MILRRLISIFITLGSLAPQTWASQDPASAPPPALASGPEARPSLEPFQQVDLDRMESFRRELTLRFVAQLRDPDFRKLLASRLGPDQTRTSLTRLVDDWAELWPTPEHRQFAARIRELDQDLRQRMGIEHTARTILGLRLIWPKGAQRVEWGRALFAVRPQTRGRGPAHVEAYDSLGRMVRLDPAAPPEVPVILAGADRGEAVRAGIETVNRGLAQAGFAGSQAPESLTGPVECAKLTAIRLAEDGGSWWGGDVEVYALVSGVDPVQDKPSIKLINLPYLRHEATDYFPNQIILFWSDYRFNAANIQFWDHGDGTNYKDLLDRILKSVTAAMIAAGVPVYAWVPALADAILQAMPSSWWVDEDSLLDTFYALEKGQPCLRRNGAAGAIRISMVPWTLQPQ